MLIHKNIISMNKIGTYLPPQEHLYDIVLYFVQTKVPSCLTYSIFVYSIPPFSRWVRQVPVGTNLSDDEIFTIYFCSLLAKLYLCCSLVDISVLILTPNSQPLFCPFLMGRYPFSTFHQPTHVFKKFMFTFGIIQPRCSKADTYIFQIIT